MNHEMNHEGLMLITLGGLLLLGLVTDAIGRKTPLPRVTLLIIFGMIIGKEGFNWIPEQSYDWFPTIANMALLMVGFLLGSKLKLSFLKNYGHAVFWVSLSVTVITFILVAVGLSLTYLNWIQALIYASIATATAPAAVTDVVEEQGSKSPFSRILLGVVAIDDAWGLMLFSIVLSFVPIYNGEGLAFDAVWHGFRELSGAILLGIVLGLPMAYLSGRIKSGKLTISEAIGMVFLCGGLAQWLQVSHLLAAMTMGAIVVNLASHHKRPIHMIENIEWPFLSLFFLLSGATLETDFLLTLSWLGGLYILLRILARIIGAGIGARLAGLTPKQQYWMGAALLPQAGIALGMALVASQRYPDIGRELLPLIIAATLFFELIGPVLTRLALIRTK